MKLSTGHSLGRPSVVSIVVSLVWMGFFTTTAHASSLYAYTSAGGGEVRATTGPISTSGSGAVPSGDSYSGFATADYGLHKVNASTISRYDLLQVTSRSEWFDTMFVNSDSAIGYISIGLDISWDNYREGGPYSGSNATFGYNFNTNKGVFSINSNLYSGTSVFSSFTDWSEEVRAGEISSRFITLTVPYAAGSSLVIRSSAICLSNGRGGGNPMAAPTRQECDAGGSVYWGGILGVFDEGGMPVANWAVTSDSGTDYARSFVPVQPGVPEPSTWAMMIAGFGLLGAQMRRRRSAALAVA